MKENLRSEHWKQEIMRLSSIKKRLKWNIIEPFMPSKKRFVCMYKMVQISKEGYEKCEVEIIDKGRYFGVNRNDLEIESDVAN